MRVLLLSALFAAAAAKEMIWNGRSAGFGNSANWQGGDPTSNDPKLQPSYTIFGNSETKAGGVAVRAPSDSYTVGTKITFYGNIKLVLGNGKGKTTLTFKKGQGDMAEFLPGSKNYPMDNVQMNGFDFNCHMNWRDSEDTTSYYETPPCEGDTAIVSTTDTRGGDFVVPDHIEAGESLFLATFGVDTYIKRLKLEDPTEDEEGAITSYAESDCTDGAGSIVAGTISLALGNCDSSSRDPPPTTFFGTSRDQEEDTCVSTCPPVGVFEDGAKLQKVTDPISGEESLVLIKFDSRGKGQIDDAEIKAEDGEDGHTYYTVTESDGTFFEHIMESNDPGLIKRRTTTTTLTTTSMTMTTTSMTTTTTVTTTTTTTAKPGDKFSLTATPEDVAGMKSSEIGILIEALNKQLTDCEAIYGTQYEGTEDKCEKQRLSVGEANNAFGAAKSAEDKAAGGGSLPIIIAAVVVVLIVVVVAIMLKKKSGGGDSRAAQASFENPMYDTKPGSVQNEEVAYDAIDDGANASSGYMDVPVGPAAGAGGSAGYMDVAAKPDGDFGGFDDGAYAEVNDDSGAAGYMDVAGGGGDYGTDDDDEDV